MKFRHQKPTDSYSTERRVNPTQQRPVFSYYARSGSTNQQNTGRRETVTGSQTKRWQRWFKSAPTYLALIMISVALLYACLLQPNPKIVVINQAGTIYRSTDEYRHTTTDIWKQSLLNRTKITLHGDDIRREVLNQFSEVSAVNIELPLLGRRPTVSLTLAHPVLELVSSNGSFYTDGRGKVLSRTGEVTKNQVEVPLIRDETGLRAEPGQTILPESQVSFLQKLHLQLKAQNIPVETIVLPADAANEADVHINGLAYYLKLSMLTDPRQAIGSYEAATAKLRNDGITPAEYIDLRVDEKVFYR